MKASSCLRINSTFIFNKNEIMPTEIIGYAAMVFLTISHLLKDVKKLGTQNSLVGGLFCNQWHTLD